MRKPKKEGASSNSIKPDRKQRVNVSLSPDVLMELEKRVPLKGRSAYIESLLRKSFDMTKDENGLDFSFEKAMEYLGISRPTLSRLLRDNKIESHWYGVERHFKREDLDKFITSELNVNREIEQFLKRVEKQPNECWHWVGHIINNGYGNFTWYGRKRTAHRAAYELFVGPIPDGLLVCHKCDVRHCVNPEHLFLGTSSDNIVDCVKKGRHKTPFRKKEN